MDKDKETAIDQNVVFSNWISCRKVTQSVSRHWSSWKDRYCILNKDTRIEMKTTASNGFTSMHLILRECRQHHYADQPHVLSLKCAIPAPQSVYASGLAYLDETIPGIPIPGLSHGRSSSPAERQKGTSVSTELFVRFRSAAAMLMFEQCALEVLALEKKRVEAFATEGLYMLKEYLHSLPTSRAFPWTCNRDRDWTLDAEETSSPVVDRDAALPIAPIISPRFAHKGVEKGGGGSLLLHQSVLNVNTKRSQVFDEISLADGHQRKSSASSARSSCKGLSSTCAVEGSGVAPCSECGVAAQGTPSLLNMTRIAVPRLNVLLLAVGTRGDVSPFAMLGQRLKREFGHCVRLATHECFRNYVTDQGLDFYPLAGDPVKLSEFMVRSKGVLIPTTPALMREVPKNFNMTVQIMRSCWSACVHASERGSGGQTEPDDDRSFCANAIISNPVSYGHIHCAEALGIPLHLMFPQPWVPTKAFPHPLSCFSYSNGWCSDNAISYQMTEQVMWLSLEAEINNFRVNTLNLAPIRRGEHGWDRLNYNKVPFVEMWSPLLAPRPKDWGDHVQVSGFFFEQSPEPVIVNATAATAAPAAPPDYNPPDDLREFLFGKPDATTRPAAPVFIGFGSMVMDEDTESMLAVILEAVALAGVRVLYQTGWSGASQETFQRLATAAEANARLIREADFDDDGGLGTEQSASVHSGETETAKFSQLEIYGSALLKRLSYAGAATSGLASACVENASNSALATASVAAANSMTARVGTVANESLKYVRHSIEDANEAAAAGVTYLGLQGAVDYLQPGLLPRPNDDASVFVTGTGACELPGYQERYEIPSPQPQLQPKHGGISSISTTSSVTTTTTPGAVAATAGAASLEGESAESGAGAGAASSIVLPTSCNIAWSASRDALVIGPCPHTWLFEHVGAVVHHGGAGTTSAGLRASKPTMVCPFFGDQFFWGEMVHRRGFGPKPCSVGKLTVPLLVEAFAVLLDAKTRTAVEGLAGELRREDGIAVGLDLFHRQLPLQDMLCDVSIFMPQKHGKLASLGLGNSSSRVARVYCSSCGLKMSTDVCELVHRYCCSGDGSSHSYSYYDHVTWDTLHPTNAVDGVWQGLAGGLQELAGGIKDAFTEPIATVYTEGVSAASLRSGIVKGVTSLITRPAIATQVLVGKVKEGADKSFGRSRPAIQTRGTSSFDGLLISAGGASHGSTLVETPELPDSLETADSSSSVSRANSDGLDVEALALGLDTESATVTPEHYLTHSQAGSLGPAEAEAEVEAGSPVPLRFSPSDGNVHALQGSQGMSGGVGETFHPSSCVLVDDGALESPHLSDMESEEGDTFSSVEGGSVGPNQSVLCSMYMSAGAGDGAALDAWQDAAAIDQERVRVEAVKTAFHRAQDAQAMLLLMKHGSASAAAAASAAGFADRSAMSVTVGELTALMQQLAHHMTATAEGRNSDRHRSQTLPAPAPVSAPVSALRVHVCELLATPPGEEISEVELAMRDETEPEPTQTETKTETETSTHVNTSSAAGSASSDASTEIAELLQAQRASEVVLHMIHVISHCSDNGSSSTPTGWIGHPAAGTGAGAGGGGRKEVPKIDFVSLAVFLLSQI